MQLRIKEKHSELSIYTGKMDKNIFDNAVKKLKIAFPALKSDFLQLLYDSVLDSQFSSDRFSDAAKHVINTCKYPSPTIAEFVQYDKFITAYTPDQFAKFCYLKEINNPFKDYLIARGSRMVYLKIEDMLKHRLNPTFKPKIIIDKMQEAMKSECFLRNGNIPGSVINHFGLPSSTQMSHLKEMLKSTRYVLQHNEKKSGKL